MLPARTIFSSFYKAALNVSKHNGFEHAGNLAFLGLLALFPFLVFVVALAGFLAAGHAGEEFIRMILTRLPPEVATALAPRINEIVSGPPQGLLTVSILGAIWTSSSAVDGYRCALNRAYRVASPPTYIWGRLFSIVQTLILSFVVVVAMVALVLLPVVWDKIGAVLGGSRIPLTNKHVAVILLLLIFAAVCVAYYFLPNLKQKKFHLVVPGAVLVTICWIVAAQGLSLYFSRFSRLSVIYGSLGGFIATLFFFYVCNVIFIYGAELNYMLKVSIGEKIEQKETVDKMGDEE